MARKKQQLNMALVHSNNKTQQDFKRGLQIRTVELCKTGAKNSSPDMVNFIVDLAGHVMVNDNGRPTTCRRKIKPHDYKQEYKIGRTFRKHVF